MTSALSDINERTLTETTVAFLTEHLGHRLSTYSRHRGKRCYYTLAKVAPDTDRAYEPYERPYWLTGPDTDAYGPSYSIRFVFADADELVCTECCTSRAWTDAHADALSALEGLAAPYLTGATAAFSAADYLHDATAMARLIATITSD